MRQENGSNLDQPLSSEVWYPNDPLSPYIRRQRTLFLQAIEKNEEGSKKALGTLRDNVLYPLLQSNGDDLRELEDHLTSSWETIAAPWRTHPPSRQQQHDALRRWGEQCNLLDDWIFETALRTLRGWLRQLSDLAERGEHAWLSLRFGVKIPAMASLSDEELDLHDDPDFKAHIEAMKMHAEATIGMTWMGLRLESLRDMHEEGVISLWDPLLDQPMAWDPEAESLEACLDRIKHFLIKQQALVKRDGVKNAPDSMRSGPTSWDAPFHWLVERQVLGRTFVQIASREGVDEDAVRRAVRRKATLIGLTLSSRT